MGPDRAIDVLIVDDDRGVRDALRRGLSAEGFAVRDAASGRAALDALSAQPPHVIVLDITMPAMTGIEVVTEVRRQGYSFPVCILSARDEVDDRVAGLRAGADDYVVKPFSIGELAARLHALVKLHELAPTHALRLGDLIVDPGRRIATRQGRDLEVTTREFDVMLAFARHPGQVLSRTQLLEQVWGYTWDVDTNVVDVFVGYVRRKSEANGETRIIHTVRGIGFVLRP